MYGNNFARMEDQQHLKKSKIAVIKSLAIVGFLSTVVVIIWAIIQVAYIMPGAFASLASIAETIQSIQNHGMNHELQVVPAKSIVNSGEMFGVTWNDLGVEGTYHFSYACTSGVTVDIQSIDTGLVHMNCTDELSVPNTVQGLTIAVSSERKRFVDLPLTVAFRGTDNTETYKKEAIVTVVNSSIPQNADLLSLLEQTQHSNEATVVEAEKPQETMTQEPVAQPTTPTQSIPKAVETTVTYMPQSNPNGFTDLAIQYLGVGTLVNNTFTPRATLENDERGAIKFEVKNVGTKTSGNWTFDATLPSGAIYHSDAQPPLKPNERAEFTVGFPVDVSPSTASIKGSISEEHDINTTNNSFIWSVKMSG